MEQLAFTLLWRQCTGLEPTFLAKKNIWLLIKYSNRKFKCWFSLLDGGQSEVALTLQNYRDRISQDIGYLVESKYCQYFLTYCFHQDSEALVVISPFEKFYRVMIFLFFSCIFFRRMSSAGESSSPLRGISAFVSWFLSRSRLGHWQSSFWTSRRLGIVLHFMKVYSILICYSMD